MVYEGEVLLSNLQHKRRKKKKKDKAITDMIVSWKFKQWRCLVEIVFMGVYMDDTISRNKWEQKGNPNSNNTKNYNSHNNSNLKTKKS